MPDETDDITAREQKERRRLARLIDALPVFSGFLTLDGHVGQAHPKTVDAFVWTHPLFAYSQTSISQIVDLFDLAAQGERIQIERPYLKSHQDEPEVLGRGLLTFAPVFNERNEVEEIAVTLIDCDDAGLISRDGYAKSRLAEANDRINAMLNLAQIVVRTSHTLKDESPQHTQSRRDALAGRLDLIAGAIDIISDLDRQDYPLDSVISFAMEAVPNTLKSQHLQRPDEGGTIPIHAVPIMILLLSELISNARKHGAWQENSPHQTGNISIQADRRDTNHGRVMRIHWIEDGGPSPKSSAYKGFGLTLGEQIFAEFTGGIATLIQSGEGISWTIDIPLILSSHDIALNRGVL